MVSSMFVAAVAAAAVQLATALPAADVSISVVGGTESDGNATPFVCGLQRQGKLFCGGSLVDEQTVVTAAHCVKDPNNVGDLTIRAGSLSRSSGGTVVAVASARNHPKYDDKTLDNDIAILKLAKPVDNPAVGFARLPEKNFDPPAGENLTVAGWGATSEASNSAQTLRQVDVPAVDRGLCQKAYATGQGLTRVSDNMFCAGLREGGQDSCQGDSGGPIIDAKTGTLVGIVSFGQGCARPGKFGIYTRLGNYVDFVQKNMGRSRARDDDTF